MFKAQILLNFETLGPADLARLDSAIYARGFDGDTADHNGISPCRLWQQGFSGTSAGADIDGHTKGRIDGRKQEQP